MLIMSRISVVMTVYVILIDARAGLWRETKQGFFRAKQHVNAAERGKYRSGPDTPCHHTQGCTYGQRTAALSLIITE